MNLQEHKKLTSEFGFLTYDGAVQRYWDRKNEAPYNKTEESKKAFYKIIFDQLNVELDYNNLIILFPLATGYGDTISFGRNRQEFITVDHCLYYLDIKDFLHKQGITYKNNISMRDQKYRQAGWAMIVIQDGIAYVLDTADPSKPNGWKESFKEIKWNEKDKHVRFDDKEIIFSGFFIERIRQFDKDAQKSFSRVLA